jgi:hypothetical protein
MQKKVYSIVLSKSKIEKWMEILQLLGLLIVLIEIKTSFETFLIP